MSKELLLRKVMVHRYTVALLVMAALALANFGLISSLLDDANPTAISLPEIGRVRYSASQLGFLSHLMVTSHSPAERQAAKEKMQAAIQQVENTYDRFKHAYPEETNRSKALPQSRIVTILYSSPHQLDKQLSAYLGHVEKVMTSPSENLSERNSSYIAVQKTLLDGNLITALDALVAQIQQQSYHKTDRLKVLVNLMTLTFIIVLALMAMFIFKPLLKNVEVYDLEREEAETHLKQELKKQIAMLAHDLKTPINAENTALKLLADQTFGDLNDSQKMVLEEMRRSNRYLYRMVDNLLTYYKTEETGFTLHTEPSDIHTVIRQVVDQDLATFIQDKNQTVILNLFEEMPLVIFDPKEMYRVLYNMVVNANHHTPEGKTITITTSVEGDKMVLSLKDEGEGMSADRIKTIFQPYQSFSKKYRQVGTGLGLYLSKKIIEAHKGKLTVKSEPGFGTEFIVNLPLVSESQTPLSQIKEALSKKQMAY